MKKILRNYSLEGEKIHMPNIIGGDQLDEDYAPWFKEKCRRQGARLRYHLKKLRKLRLSERDLRAADYCLDYYEIYQKEVLVGTLAPKTVKVLYNLQNLQQLPLALAFKRYLVDKDVPYEEKPALGKVQERLEAEKNKLEVLLASFQS